MADIQKRLDDLEIKLAHQEQQIHDLSEMVSDQWQFIERLGGALSKANTRLESLENIDNNPNNIQSALDEKPPHY